MSKPTQAEENQKTKKKTNMQEKHPHTQKRRQRVKVEGYPIKKNFHNSHVLELKKKKKWSEFKQG